LTSLTFVISGGSTHLPPLRKTCIQGACTIYSAEIIPFPRQSCLAFPRFTLFTVPALEFQLCDSALRSIFRLPSSALFCFTAFRAKAIIPKRVDIQRAGTAPIELRHNAHGNKQEEIQKTITLAVLSHIPSTFHR